MDKEPANRYSTFLIIGYGASLICILLLLSLNDRRYGTQIDNIWYIIFSVLLWMLFQSARKKAKIVVVALLAANLILLILYVRLLPPFTYKAALRELSSQYPEVMLPSSWDRKNQSLAPYYEMGKLKYYRYVFEYKGQYLYFDQYTGSYGEVVTGRGT